jgi:ferritin-like protein
MAGSSASLHESTEVLKPETIDRHRAIASLMEELEAVDWYDQRVDAAHDDELRAILAHNRDEEKEHAVMVLEWLRRHDAHLDEQLRTYLFAAEPVLEIEKAGDGSGGAAKPDGSLGIGSLREEVQR